MNLRDKHRAAIPTFKAKQNELQVEIKETKKLNEQTEQKVRDISENLAKEVSEQLKANCRIVVQ